MVRIVPKDVEHAVIAQLDKHSLEIVGFEPVAGGCINHGGKLSTSQGDFFLKWNDRSRFPGMFEAESHGLRLLSGRSAIRIPHVIGFGDAGVHQFLLLEHIRQTPPSKNFWLALGQQLAFLHRSKYNTCGLDHDNYIGSLHQSNKVNSSWVDFFIQERLTVQLKMAVDANLVDQPWSKKIEELYAILPSLLVPETPSLLHGDLWSGNILSDELGRPCLIDPAVYYGHREVDLAMTRLFGGFDPVFYGAYNEIFPLEPGYQRRFDLYNLYPLFVHLNLFGVAYKKNINDVLNRFL